MKADGTRVKLHKVERKAPPVDMKAGVEQATKAKYDKIAAPLVKVIEDNLPKGMKESSRITTVVNLSNWVDDIGQGKKDLPIKIDEKMRKALTDYYQAGQKKAVETIQKRVSILKESSRCQCFMPAGKN